MGGEEREHGEDVMRGRVNVQCEEMEREHGEDVIRGDWV
jgi:hypothetical protein